MLVDNTYGITQSGMPLMVTVGINNCGKTFFISFAFLLDQTEESYTWALSCNKELFAQLNTPTVILGPGAIATDCDQALRNATSKVFPESPALLCAWHATKNIQQHCKLAFSTEKDQESFEKAWQALVKSKTEEEYENQLNKFTEKWRWAYTIKDGRSKSCVQYIKDTWLKSGRKEALISAWVNQYTHFGITVTSR